MASPFSGFVNLDFAPLSWQGRYPTFRSRMSSSSPDRAAMGMVMTWAEDLWTDARLPPIVQEPVLCGGFCP